MKLTDERKAKNAIKWIDALPKHRKTRGQLRCGEKPSNYAYCCLGVGAKVCKTEDDMENAYAYHLPEKVGILDHRGEFSKHFTIAGKKHAGSLANLNDGAYSEDKDFTRVRKFMLRHLSAIFEPGVAKILKAHYKENP